MFGDVSCRRSFRLLLSGLNLYDIIRQNGQVVLVSTEFPSGSTSVAAVKSGKSLEPPGVKGGFSFLIAKSRSLNHFR